MTEDVDELLRALASAPPLPIDRLEPGRQLGPYRLDAPLGRGGMGQVFRATDTRLGRAVAIKVLDRAGPEACDALLREARAAAAVDHPAVVTVYDVGVADDGRAFVAMELVAGAPLSERGGPAVTQRPRSEREGLRLARAIAGGLAHLHERGLVHRDLTPSNVVVRPDGSVKLVDFGLAVRIRDPAVPAGTPHFVAPEVRDGAPVDARADVYAFGVLLRWLGSGTVDGRAPPGLRALSERCTARDPRQRPADGRALVRELDRVWRRRILARSGLVVLGTACLSALVAIALSDARDAVDDIRPPSGAEPSEAPQWVRLTDLHASAMLFEGMIAPDGTRLAYAERRGVFVRDLASGAIESIAGAELGAHCVAWSGDGTRLYVGGEEGVHATQLGEGAPVALGRVVEGGGCPVASPDGRWLAIERTDRLELVDLARPHDPPRVLVPAPQRLVVAAFSPRSDRLAVVRVFLAADGTPNAELSVHDLDPRVGARVLHTDPAFVMPTRGVALTWLGEHSLLVGRDASGLDEGMRELVRTPADRWAPVRYATVPFDPCRLSVDRAGRVTATSHTQDAAVLVSALGDGDMLSEPRRISRSLHALEPTDWTHEGDAVLALERALGSFRAFAHPLDERLPEPLDTGGPATWPVRSDGGAFVFFRPPQESVGAYSLVWRANGSERVLMRIDEPPSDGLGVRPPPATYAVRCDPASPRCVVLGASRAILVDVPSGEHRVVRSLGDERWPPIFAVRWDAYPLLAIPTADARRIALVRVEKDDPMSHLALPAGCHVQRVEWNSAGDALFASGYCAPPEPYRVMRVSLDGEVTHLLRSAERWLGVARLSPDGRWLALYGHEFRSNIWQAR